MRTRNQRGTRLATSGCQGRGRAIDERGLVCRGKRHNTLFARAAPLLMLLLPQLGTRATQLATGAVAFGRPLRHSLERRNKAEHCQQCPEQPQREIEGADGKEKGTASRKLQDRAGLAAFAGASRATRDMSRGPSASRNPSSAACVPAFACTRPTSPASRTRSWTFSTLTASRARAHRQRGLSDAYSARGAGNRAPIHYLPHGRLIHAVMRAPKRPVLPAALTTVSPALAGAANATVA